MGNSKTWRKKAIKLSFTAPLHSPLCMHFNLIFVQVKFATSQLCKLTILHKKLCNWDREQHCGKQLKKRAFIQLCASHCARRSLCKSHHATHNCVCATNDYATVKLSNHATVQEKKPFVQCTTVLHQSLPLFSAPLSAPPPPLLSPTFPSSSPQSLAPLQAVGAGLGRNWGSLKFHLFTPSKTIQNLLV